MNRIQIEWPTFGLIIACYCIWLASTYAFVPVAEAFGIVVSLGMLFGITSLVTAFHTSLQHEVVHGHPTPIKKLNEALVFFPLILVYPFQRYRDLHLKHHIDENLTDPYDDPESYYWPQCDSYRLNRRMRFVLGLNNTLVGRLVLGPFLGLYGFYRTELHRLMCNEPGICNAWTMHFVGIVLVLFWVIAVCNIPFWIYLWAVALPAVSWILIRSFAEHQASHAVGGRSAIIEGHPFFAMLYLNNNLHLVHHAHPSLAWYELPDFYKERKSNYLAANENYFFTGYWEVFRRFAFTRKQPVFHPLWHLDPHRLSGDEKTNGHETK